MKCFMYCEWIDETRVRKSMPDCVVIDTVTLPDHKLVFTTYVEDEDKTERGSGCHMVPSPGDQVLGLLVELNDEEVAIAAGLSRVDQGRYTPQNYTVIDSQGNAHDSVAYVIKHPLGPSKPSDEYRDHMVVGGRNMGLPEEYIAMIESL